MRTAWRRRAAAGGTVGALLALALVPVGGAAAAPAAAGDGRSSLVMVLDSSGSMADDDGSGGRTRMEAARAAVGTVVDSLPDKHPTGLRVYGADRERGCTDTRLVTPVRPLDRAGLKRAVASVRPKGDTPIGLSLQKAAADLPAPPAGAIGTRTILLISDGEDNCGTPKPCEVAERLAKNGVGLRVDTVGFQVRGKAREQLECIAEAGNGRYYDAPDAAALARQLQRASLLSADGYRLSGKRVEGAAGRDGAPGLVPGQYLDTIGPGEKRYYALDLDAASTAHFSATAVPQPGAAVDSFDKLQTSLTYPYSGGGEGTCATNTENFSQDEGAVTLTSAIARIPSETGYSACDEARRFWLVVERESKPASDAARWPLELTFDVESPPAKGVVLAQSQPKYGKGGADAVVPLGDPRDVRGGTGFNDARAIGPGVWRDRVVPSQTLWFRVPVGWGQQLRYDVEFANEPTVNGSSSVSSYGATEVYTPARHPVGRGSGEFSRETSYTGRPAALKMGTVPVAWTNRHEGGANVVPVHAKGDFYLAVTLGAEAAEIARNPEIGVVLRVAVLGDELAGPQHGAPVLDRKPTDRDDSPGRADSGGTGGAGWTGTAAAAAAGGAVVLIAGAVLVLVRRRTANRTTARTTTTETTRRSA